LAAVLSGLLYLLPALTLALVLFTRRYPGERSLLALRHRRPPARWPRPSATAPAGRRVSLAAVRGGLLIACSLAVRPPPAQPAAS
jgi:hypothetical protein